MAELIEQIINFFTSNEFQVLMTSIGSIILGLSPVLYKLINSKIAKWKARLEVKSKELVEALTIIEDYKKVADDEISRAKEVIAQLTGMIEKQNEAMNLAFSRSNLKEDVKSTIDKILHQKTIPEVQQAPSVIHETPVEANESKEDEQLPIQTLEKRTYTRGRI